MNREEGSFVPGRVARRTALVRLFGISLLLLFGLYFYVSWTPMPTPDPVSAANVVPSLSQINEDPLLDCFRCNHEKIHIGVVAIGTNASRDLVITLKSILARRSTALYLHILVDHASKENLEVIFAHWQLACVSVEFHLLLDHTVEIAWVKTVHASGPYGLAKLTYDRILSNVAKVIAIDLDIVFDADVAELWRLFDDFSSQQFIAAAEQQSDWYLGTLEPFLGYIVWPAVGRGLNSGIMLLHLDRMRRHDWRGLWTEPTRKQLDTLGTTALADQDVFNLAMTLFPQHFFALPCNWNIQLHDHSRAHLCYQTQRVKVIHWNSPLRHRFDNKEFQVFRDLYDRIIGTDGSKLRQAPIQCGVEAVAAPTVDETDPCAEIRNSALRKYRVHPNYVKHSANPLLYECSLSGGPLNVMELIRRTNIHHILSRSAVLAQYTFFKLIDAQREILEEEDNIVLPKELVAVCVEIVDHRSRNDVTLATQLSFDRLHQLPRLLKQWTGPMSISIYLKDSELIQLNDFVESNAPLISTHPEVRIHCVFQENSIYPINILRNMAISQVSSEFVFSIDVDFSLSTDCYKLINTRTSSSGYSHKDKFAFVVPAFESDSYNMKVPVSKSALFSSFSGKEIRQFRGREWDQGHAATDYTKWFHTQIPYRVKYQTGYEPYVVVNTRNALFDERFVGFGWNKISFLETLTAKNYEFMVFPDVFIIHSPHSPSRDLTSFRDSVAYKNCIKLIYEEFQSSLAEKAPEEVEEETPRNSFEAAIARKAARLRAAQ